MPCKNIDKKKALNFISGEYRKKKMKISSSNIWRNWQEINEISITRKIIFFGRGEWLEKSLPYLNKIAAYIIDNNRYEHGQQENGLKIYAASKINDEDPNKILVIITTTSFESVQKQLENMGLLPGKNFVVSPALKNFEVISKIQNLNQTIYFTCSDQASQGGGLYSFNLKKREKNLIIKGHCHGIAQDDNVIALIDDEVGVRILDKRFNTKRIIKLPQKSRPHGVSVCQKRNQVFVNLSGRDSIGIYDLDSGEGLEEIAISDKFKNHGIAQHHINDSTIYGDYLLLSMFSLTGNWKSGIYDGAIIQIDLKTKNIVGPVAENLWMPHTPIICDGILHYCDSMRGTVINMTWKILAKFSGFIRGIAWDGHYYFVGQSAHRYVDRLQGTSQNISLDTGIYLLDPVNHITKFFSIPELTDINSVFILQK